jgi:hypothetical protein
MIDPHGISLIRGRVLLTLPKITVTPWPLSNISALTVKRHWAAGMLQLYRRISQQDGL